MLVIQLCPTLCHAMDCKPDSLSSVHGIFQEVGSHSLLQSIFLTQGYNLSLPHCRQTLYQMSEPPECIYVCVCVCVCVYVYMYICVYICMYMYILCTYMCVYVCMYTHVYVYICICIYVCIYVCVYFYICIYIYVNIYICKYIFKFISLVQLLGHVRLLATPWTAAHQASLSITNSQSLLKLMSIESVMPSNHLILCCPLLLPPSILPSIRVFSIESVLHIRCPKYWSFSFSISPSNEYSGLLSFRID